MTDKQFKKNVRRKQLIDFTKEELFHACSYEKYSFREVVKIATEKGWDDVVIEANRYEQPKQTTGWFRTPPTIK